MAESILYSVAANLVTKLGSAALREVQFLWGLDDEIEKLKHTISAMEAVLLDAEEQQSKSHGVKNWVSKLRDAFYDVDDLIDEFSYETLRQQATAKRRTKEVRKVLSVPHQLAFRFQMSHKIEEIRKKLNAIDADRKQFHFSERTVNLREIEVRKRRETSSFIYDDEVIGRDDDKKAIIDLLILDTNSKDRNIEVISVVGMGGLGKTALAQSVYNNKEITKHFELKLWVCISEEFDVKVIIEKIIESATRKKPEILQMDSLQRDLREQIDGNKYLLVMDDVWNEDYEKWVNLRRCLMSGARGSRILITTRHQRVAKTFDTTSFYSLGKLDDRNSWLLFKKMAFRGKELENEVENLNLVEISKEIVAKLKGVPLAIRTIGRLLHSKNSKLHLWLSFKDNELSRVIEQREETQFMLSILELSYNHLHYNLKQCFLYCALFPKDHNIKKDVVIKQWVAQGFVQSNGTVGPNDIGEDYFMELLSRSFFQDATKNEMGDIIKCKMHDFMHVLASSIVKNEYVCLDVKSRVVDIEGIRHVSIYHSIGIKMEPLDILFKAKNLRTLIIEAPSKDWKKLLNIIPNFSRLRILSFSLSSISTFQKLPKSIGKLKHLRYLNICFSEIIFLPNSIIELYNLETLILDGCIYLQELPRDANNWMKLRYLSLARNSSIQFIPDSISALYYLETLILKDCSLLKELPKHIKKCINLKHLDLRGCTCLTHVPKGLGELTNLQTMNLFVLKKDIGCELSELNRLSKLRGSLTIKGLEVCTTDNLEKNFFNLRQKVGVQDLKLVWNYSKDESKNTSLDNDYERVLECLQPHSNVRKIQICGYQGVQLCDWLSSNTFAHLVSLKLSCCFRLEALSQFGQFPSLKHLSLKTLPCIEYIENNDYPSSSVLLPSLEKLSMVVKGGCVSSNTLVHLVSIKLSDCCKLQTLQQFCQFPFLKHLVLKSLPCIEYIDNNDYPSSSMFFPSLEKLSMVDLKNLKGWWEGELSPNSVSFSATMSCLSQLEIKGCPQLASIPWHAPNLKSLEISSVSIQLLNTVIGTTTSHCVEESSSTGSKLSSFSLSKIEDLEFLPERFFYQLRNLENLIVKDCKSLQISSRLVQYPINEDLDDEVVWKEFRSLRFLNLEEIPKLEYLPNGMKHVTTIEVIAIAKCPNLMTLPEWISDLTSLSFLLIFDCPKLTSLPEGIHHLRSLQLLKVWNCPKLVKRYKKGKGEDWPKISHVPIVDFSNHRD